ncbi:dioxygenase [Bordetella flabilis]|uniref:6-chlorohydroxyquinol-1,2-dioxygenase n=1 Tax=Bordetella flabilis TaxID=463014 RepID=A0A193G8X3_9BORD|nr:dioxygenase [Bordetella flabilis]ANN76437.1 6-chlorohydroxyquinol-1,2-dioxygenase [Bordetella flabilis]
MAIEHRYFSEDASIDIVTGRHRHAPDARMKQVMDVVVRKLHEAVKEIEPTQEEWMRAIAFLTRTGQMCDASRQEYILLSDVLGVSMLVDAINHRHPAGATASTVLGPFHVVGAPERPMGANISVGQGGEPLVVSGTVRDTAGRPVGGATLDVWMANHEGLYDVQQQGVRPEGNLRGLFRTGADGRYEFRTIKPMSYPIPADGTVGRLLEGLARHPFRPAHIHFIVQAAGYAGVVTHIFDQTDPYLASDAVFGVKESLLANFERTHDPEVARRHGLDGEFWRVRQDFTLMAESTAAAAA